VATAVVEAAMAGATDVGEAAMAVATGVGAVGVEGAKVAAIGIVKDFSPCLKVQENK